MIESPIIQELVAEGRHKDILRFLAVRFGPLPGASAAEIKQILDETVLDAVVELAASSPDLSHFETAMRAIPRPPNRFDFDEEEEAEGEEKAG
jgi:hypothetical protein